MRIIASYKEDASRNNFSLGEDPMTNSETGVRTIAARAQYHFALKILKEIEGLDACFRDGHNYVKAHGSVEKKNEVFVFCTRCGDAVNLKAEEA